jgi:hypothetical protein
VSGAIDNPLVLWTIVAGAADAVVLGGYLLARRRQVSVPSWCARVGMLLKAGDYRRLIKLCTEAPRAALVRLTLFLLSLEIPAKSRGTGEAGGYDFAKQARERIDAESAASRRGIHLRMALVAAGMSVAVCLGAFVLVVYLLGSSSGASSGLFPWPLVVGLAPLVGLVLTALRWYRQVAGIDAVIRVFLPHLRPAEQMEPEEREVAAKARRMLEWWS